jgi:hypothetical protein
LNFFLSSIAEKLRLQNNCEFCVNSSNLNLALRVLDAEREEEFFPARNSFRNYSPNLRAEGIAADFPIHPCA